MRLPSNLPPSIAAKLALSLTVAGFIAIIALAIWVDGLLKQWGYQ
jgi:hypothetical protein